MQNYKMRNYNLLEIQRNSYNWFLEEGLQEVFRR